MQIILRVLIIIIKKSQFTKGLIDSDVDQCTFPIVIPRRNPRGLSLFSKINFLASFYC